MYRYLFLISAMLFSNFAFSSDDYYARSDRDSPLTDPGNGTPPKKKKHHKNIVISRSPKKKPPSNTEVSRKNYRVKS